MYCCCFVVVVVVVTHCCDVHVVSGSVVCIVMVCVGVDVRM